MAKTLDGLATLAQAPATKKARKAKREGEEPQVKHISFLAVGDRLYEQIFRDGKHAFVEYNTSTGEPGVVSQLEVEGVKIAPIDTEEVALGLVGLPTAATEYGDTASLLAAIEEFSARYLDVSASFRKFAAYYVLLSWLYDRFNTLPYLRFLGDTGTGKSRGLDVFGTLCYKPILASGCITPAPIYRLLNRWSGTLILDEADLRNSDEYAEVIKILNCGFERGRPVVRSTKDQPDKLQFLPTYGPKVLATRRRFTDAALEGRCLSEIMKETGRDDIPAVLDDQFFSERQELRNKLLMFRLRNYRTIDPGRRTGFDLTGIEPRLKQVSAAFAGLFANQPGVREHYRQFIWTHQRELVEQRSMTRTGQVVEVLFSLLGRVSSNADSHALETFETLETADTGERLLRVSAGDIAAKLDMKHQVVGQILKVLGLRTKPKKLQGEMRRLIVYDADCLRALRRRYIPADDEPVSMVSMVSTTGETVANETAGGDDFREVSIPWRPSASFKP